MRSHLRGAHILHFASHAFVLPREPGEPAGKRPSLDRTSSLERTGLVVGRIDSLMDDLKNGHLPDQEHDNILFTKEVAGLPLDETWLVTLSACSTGRGDPVSGEGVIGLQRGFFTAGVQHVAMTLWPLSDNYAPDFMAKFYSKVFAMNRPDAAMWQTQRDELVRLRNAGGDWELQFGWLVRGRCVRSGGAGNLLIRATLNGAFQKTTGNDRTISFFPSLLVQLRLTWNWPR
ncbi:MAG: CHAT domain-containing protein [Verrucomicrobiales bacterium]